MSRLIITKDNIIEPKVDVLKKLLEAGEYIICGDTKDGKLENMVIENVYCIKNNMLISFCVSNKPGKNKFRLHDDSAFSGKILDMFADVMVNNFDIFIRDCNNVDRKHIYGKLGTKYENQVVFEY